MIVLDTNVVSEFLRPRPDPSVKAWLNGTDSHALAVTAVTVAELLAGVAFLPRGRRRATLGDSVAGILGEAFAGAVLPFDADSAGYYADVLAARRTADASIAVLDAQIAAICRQYDATLATRNTRDFKGVGLELIDPWAAGPPSPPP